MILPRFHGRPVSLKPGRLFIPGPQEVFMIPLQSFFPFWQSLAPSQQALLTARAAPRRSAAGEVLHWGGDDCAGLFLVSSGRLRVYTLSQEGREITLYRLGEGDICLFSASCMIRNIQFDLYVAAETDTEYWVVPAEDYRGLMQQSAPLANYTSQIMAERFSNVMWLMEQVLWKRQDQRLAAFLLEEKKMARSNTLRLTHEAIANHLGTAREVVTRMLRYFQEEGWIRLARGTVTMTDEKSLDRLARAEL